MVGRSSHGTMVALAPALLAASSCVEIPGAADLACKIEHQTTDCSGRSERPPAGHCSYFVQLLTDDALSRDGEFFILYDADDGRVVGSRANASLHRADEYGTHSGVWRVDVPATDGRLVIDGRREREREGWGSDIGCHVLRRELPRCTAGSAHDASLLSVHATTVTNPALMLQNGCLYQWEIAMFGEFRPPRRD